MEKSGADSSLFKNVDKDIEKAGTLARELASKIQVGFKNQKEVTAFEKKFEQLNNILGQVNVGLTDIAKPANFKSTSKELDQLNRQLRQIEQSQKDLRDSAFEASQSFAKGQYSKELDSAIKKGTKLGEVLEKVAKQQFDAGRTTLNKQLNSIVNKDAKSSTPGSITAAAMDKIGPGKLTSGIQEYKKAIVELATTSTPVQEIFNKLKEALNDTDKEFAESEEFVKQYLADVREFSLAMSTAGNTGAKGRVTSALNRMASAGGVDTSGNYHALGDVAPINEYNNALNQNKQLLQDIEAEEERLKKKESEAISEALAGLSAENEARKRMDNLINEQTNDIINQVKAQEQVNKTFDSLKNLVSRFVSVGFAAQKARQEIVKTYNDVKNLDKAFGQIAMVTSFSLEDMWNKYDKYAKIANEMGQTTLSVVQASGLYFQQGLEEAEALELTASTMKLATLAGLDFEQATSLMTSAVRGFHMEMSEGEHVTDVYSELAAHAAASVNDIATAMSRTAAIANSAGMEFETTSAMLTTMIEATQESPETLGTAMKTVIARFTELKKNVSATESEFEDLDYNKVDTALKSIGVALKDVNGQFRDIDDVFLEVADKWDTLDRNTQRYIATTAAGSRQQSRFIALMENSARVHELLETAQDSAGRSSEQFAKYADTLENKVNRLKNSWEQFKLSIINSDMFKGGVDLLNNFITSISKVDKKRLLATGIIGITVGKQIVTNMIDTWKKSATLLTKGITDTLSRSVNQAMQGNALNTSMNRIWIGMQNKINNVGLLIAKDIGLNLVDADAKANNLILDFIKQQSELDKIEKEMRENLVLQDSAETNEKERNALVERENLLLEKQNQIRMRQAEIQATLNKEYQAGIGVEELGNLKLAASQQAAGDEKIAASNTNPVISTTSAVFGTAITSAITTGLMMALSGADFKTTLKTAGISALTSALPMILNAVLPVVGNFLMTTALPFIGSLLVAAAPALISVAIGAIFVGIIDKITTDSKERIKKLKDSAEAIQKELAKQEERYNKAASDSKEEQDKLKNIKDLREEYNELNNKVIRTTEEQEKYNELVETIKNDYPELNSYYNETTGQLQIQNEEWDKLIDKQEESVKLAAEKRLQEGLAFENLQKASISADTKLERENIRYASSNFGDYYTETPWQATADAFGSIIERTYSLDALPGGKNQSDFNKYISDKIGSGELSGLEALLMKAFDKGSHGLIATTYMGLQDVEKTKNDTSSIIKQALEEGQSNEAVLRTLEDAGFNSEIAAKATNLNLANQQDLAKLLDMLENNTEEYDKLLDQYEQNVDKEEKIQLEKIKQQKAEEYTEYAKAVYGENDAVSAYYGRKTAEATFEYNELAYGDELLNTKYDELLSYQKTAIETWYKGLTEEQRESYGLNKNATDMRNLYSQIINKDEGKAREILEAINATMASNFTEDFLQNLTEETTEEQKEKITEFGDNLITYTLNDLENASKPAIATIKKLDNEYLEKKIEEQQVLTDNLHNLTGMDFSNVSLEDLQAWNNYWNGVADVIGSDKTEAMAGQLTKIKGNLSDSQFMTLTSSLDWSEINGSNLEQYQKEFVESWKEAGAPGGEAAAKAFFNKWKDIEAENDIYSEWFTNGAQIEAYKASVESLYEAINKNEKAFEDSFATNATWIESDADKVDDLKSAFAEMEEAGATGIGKIEDYYKIVDGQVKLNAKAVRKVYEDNVKGHIDYLKNLQDKTSKFKSEEDVKKYLQENTVRTYDKSGQIIESHYKNDAEQIAKWWKKSGENIEEFQKILKENIDDLEQLEELESSRLNIDKDINAKLKDDLPSISNMISAYKSLNDEIREDGHVSADSIESFKDNLKELNITARDFGVKTKGLSSFLYEENGAIKLNSSALEEYITKILLAAEAEGKMADYDLILRLKALKKEFEETTKQVAEDNREKIQSAYEEWQEALDKVREKQEAVAEAEEEVIEKEEELIEKQEELQKIYYGEENHKNQNDYLYNYNIELEQLEQNAKKAKEALDNLKSGDDVHQKVQDYVAALRDEVTNYKAQNEVIKQYMENQKRMLDEGLSQRLEQLKAEGAVDTSTNVSDFYYERNGRFYIDYSKLNAAKLPDDVSDFIEQQVDNLNKYGKAYEDNLSKIEAAQKEFLDWQKAARDKQIATENKVIEILKKKDQEELDNLKEKYEGMKAADDDYTSALEESIKKQRDLRNQANQWDDLAEKEKKLSLQQRDTSGANAKEIRKTQEDITKTRESLLDSAVDNIINNLKELYEEQEETRQAEIEYRQAILDNKNYVDEATAIINNWGSVEEAKAWFMKFDEEFINASDATIAKLLEDYEGYYNNTVEYTEAMGISYEDIINQTSGEIEEKVRETSETLTEESERALDETMDKVHEAQEKGREEVEAAEKAVEDAKNKVVEATRAVAEALEEARKKQEAYNKAIAEQSSPGDKGGNTTPDYPDDDNNGTDGNGEKNDSGPTELQKETAVRNALASLSQGYRNDTDLQKVADMAKLTKEEVINIIKEKIVANPPHHGYMSNYSVYWRNSTQAAYEEAKSKGGIAFKNGGLVDYTGPAWVDGTPSKPEAFLSASDTEMIREFIDLQKLTFTRPSTDSFTRTNNYGDPVFNIDINVDSISSDYDVDRLVERVHEDILSITSAPGQSVILSK